jgi:hypothetical protein
MAAWILLAPPTTHQGRRTSPYFYWFGSTKYFWPVAIRA